MEQQPALHASAGSFRRVVTEKPAVGVCNTMDRFKIQTNGEEDDPIGIPSV
jgi:hypothetical protein